jgi:hypothetical protein
VLRQSLSNRATTPSKEGNNLREKKVLLEEYINPFFEAKKEKFNKPDNLRATIAALQNRANKILAFQRHGNEIQALSPFGYLYFSFHGIPLFKEEPSNQIDILKDMRAIQEYGLDESLSSDTKLQEAYQKLAAIYCYEDIQVSKFPDYTSAQIQTCIRELFHRVKFC